MLATLPSRELSYVSTRSGRATIWLSDETGRDARELTPDHPGAIDLGWSPDGRTLFFSTQLSANLDMFELDEGRHGIYALDVESGSLRQLTDHDALNRYPEMSPDGRTILYLTDVGTAHRQVWAMNPDGSGKRRITDIPGHKARPTFSPDGSSVALQANDPTAQIYLMNPDGSGLRNISRNRFSERYPSWSSDGRQLTFTSVRRGDDVARSLLAKVFWKALKPLTGLMRSVWVMDVDGSRQRPLLRLRAESKHAVFAPDGPAIAFESDLTGRDQVYVADEHGENLRQVTFEGTNFKPVYRPIPSSRPGPGESLPRAATGLRRER